ncbi:MAG: hypothetical protein WCC90_17610 [Methylocella sp.]
MTLLVAPSGHVNHRAQCTLDYRFIDQASSDDSMKVDSRARKQIVSTGSVAQPASIELVYFLTLPGELASRPLASLVIDDSCLAGTIIILGLAITHSRII